MMRLLLIAILISPALAGPPATAPSDPTMDFLLSHATTVPADATLDAPATQPAVLQSANNLEDESRPGELILSDGHTLTGRLSTTLRQPIRVWDDAKGEYQDIPFSMIQSMQAQVVWERDEPEWKFKESGSDIKEYSGRTYPARMTNYLLTLTDGTTVAGGVADPVYLDNADGHKIFILHKRDKGDPGQTLGQLIYVKQVNFKDAK
jgi:hypothetical protein